MFRLNQNKESSSKKGSNYDLLLGYLRQAEQDRREPGRIRIVPQEGNSIIVYVDELDGHNFTAYTFVPNRSEVIRAEGTYGRTAEGETFAEYNGQSETASLEEVEQVVDEATMQPELAHV